ncbi:histidine kinase, partial [Pseudomonas putida]
VIDKVRTIHLQVTGTAPDGRSYAASDPDLLTWVHVAEVSSFLAAHLRYRDPQLSRAGQDAYYDEIALIAERLGARNVPRSCQQVDEYLQRMRPQLHCDARSLEVIEILLQAPAPSRLAQPVGRLMLQAGIDLLPAWAQAMLGLHQGPLQQRMIRLGLNRTAPVLRWAMRDGSAHRAKRRMGIE